MIEVFCTCCGKGELDQVVRREERPSDIHDGIDVMESESVETHFFCESCDRHEIINQGTLAIKKSQNFDLRECTKSGRLTVKIDSKSIGFTDVDEQIATSTHYTTAGARSTSRVHVVHIHAINPPTLSKGRHEVEIGNSINKEMVLSDIYYQDSTRRTLKFHKNLSDGSSELSNEAVDKAIL